MLTYLAWQDPETTFGSSVQSRSFRGLQILNPNLQTARRSCAPSSVGKKKLIFLKDSGSGALPRIPCPKDLSCNLVWIRPGDRFELLQPTREAIRQIQVAELVRGDPV